MLVFLMYLLVADPVADLPERAELEPVWEHLYAQRHLGLGELVVATGKQFLGKPYVGKTLELEGEERLSARLDCFDCFTFMETALSVARVLKGENPNLEQVWDMVRKLRYRDGEVSGYPSRLHYTCDWGFENARFGRLEDVTKKIGGVARDKQINFMTNHRDAYAQLGDDANWQAMKLIEQNINQRSYFYIPQAEISKHESGVKDGDLIFLTTSIPGLDISHVGIAVRKNKHIHLMHASLKLKKVVISKKPLADYVIGNKNQDGIMIYRPKL